MATEAVVLAAGSGSRFGGGKLLTAYGKGVLLDGALAAAFAAPVRRVTVVTGADGSQVADAAIAFDHGVQIVDAHDWEEGMAASLRAAISSLPPDTEACMVFLGDMPRVPHEVLKPLCEAVANGAPAAAPVYEGQRGNPVVLARTLFPDVLQLRGDVGARRILDALGDRLALVEAPDDGILFDVDHRRDVERA